MKLPAKILLFLIISALLLLVAIIDRDSTNAWHQLKKDQPILLAQLDDIFVYEMPNGKVIAKSYNQD